MTEFDFIRRYLKKQQDDAQVVLGIGDDAAIIRPQVGFDLCFSSDMLLKGRHFFADVQPGLESTCSQYFRYGCNGGYSALGFIECRITGAG